MAKMQRAGFNTILRLILSISFYSIIHPIRPLISLFIHFSATARVTASTTIPPTAPENGGHIMEK